MSDADDPKGKDKTDWGFIDIKRPGKRANESPQTDGVDLMKTVAPAAPAKRDPLPSLDSSRGVLMESSRPTEWEGRPRCRRCRSNTTAR